MCPVPFDLYDCWAKGIVPLSNVSYSDSLLLISNTFLNASEELFGISLEFNLAYRMRSMIAM